MDNASLLPPSPVVSPPSPPVQPVKVHSPFKNILFLTLAVLMLAGSSFYIYSQLAVPAPQPQISQAQPQPTPVPELTLTLTAPVLDTVADTNQLTVAGRTAPNTPVVLMTETHDSSLESDSQGNFSGDIELDSGVNLLTITVLHYDGREKSLTREVIYDNQVLGKNTSPETPAETGKPPRKFVETSLESLNRGNQVDKNTRYVDEKNQPLKPNLVKPKDRLFVILDDDNTTAAGQLKKALKIITLSATDSAGLKTSKRRAIQGVVTGISGSVIQLSHQIQRDRQYRVLFNDQTVVRSSGTDSAVLTPSLLQVGQRIIVVGSLTETGEILAARIKIIPGKATGIFTKQPVTPFPSLPSTPSATPIATLTPSPTP